MITFKNYRLFLEDLSKQGISSLRVDQLIEKNFDHAPFVLKHDVEANLPLALKLARIEADCGHLATYYFQGDLLLEDDAERIVKEISNLGHEVTYHYDVLDSCDGDYSTAKQEFDRYREIIENILGQPIRTVCPHGNPTKVRDGWRSNKDFFRNKKIRESYPNIHDIVVDFDTILPQGTYLSDAGFALRKIGNISGNDLSNETAINDGSSVDWSAVGSLVKSGNGVVLSVHSHRLRDSDLSILLLRLRMNALRSGYRLVKRFPLARSIASRWYSHARKF